MRHVRACYGGALTMADHWLGKLLDKLDHHRMWDDTVVVLTTDHGHFLGERGYWGKMQMALYDELAHIPLLVCAPGAAGGRRVRRALTTTIDLMPTFLELHGAALPEQVQGRSLRHLLAADGDQHAAVLYGGFAKDVCLTDGRYRYFRQAQPESWVHHHTMMPRGSQDFLALPRLDPEYGYFLKYASDRGYPQLRWRQPSEPVLDAAPGNLIFDAANDPEQRQPVRDPALEQRLAALLRERLSAVEAPDCQYLRLGL